MTTTHAAAQAELTHAGRDITQADTDQWLRGITNKLHQMGQRTSAGFDPAAPISDLAARLLCVSNAMHFGEDRP